MQELKVCPCEEMEGRGNPRVLWQSGEIQCIRPKLCFIITISFSPPATPFPLFIGIFIIFALDSLFARRAANPINVIIGGRNSSHSESLLARQCNAGLNIAFADWIYCEPRVPRDMQQGSASLGRPSDWPAPESQHTTPPRLRTIHPARCSRPRPASSSHPDMSGGPTPGKDE